MPTLYADTSYVDPTRKGSWQDPAMYASAMAPNGHLEFLWFRLDHEKQTARLLRVIPREASGSTQFGTWVLAEVQPYQAVHDLATLPGRTLKLHGYPFNSCHEYTIIGEAI